MLLVGLPTCSHDPPCLTGMAGSLELLHQEALGGQVGATARECQVCCEVVPELDLQVEANSCCKLMTMLHCLQLPELCAPHGAMHTATLNGPLCGLNARAVLCSLFPAALGCCEIFQECLQSCFATAFLQVIPRSILLADFEGVQYLLCALGDGRLSSFTLTPKTSG